MRFLKLAVAICGLVAINLAVHAGFGIRAQQPETAAPPEVAAKKAPARKVPVAKRRAVEAKVLFGAATTAAPMTAQR